MDITKLVKFKIQALPKKKQDWSYWAWVCVWYIDARDCQDYLDQKYPNARQCEFYEVKDKTFCKVWININWEWLWRSDSWALSANDNVDNDVTSKWDTSDAFKRACVMWWIWRDLYSLPQLWISQEEYQANKFKINDFIKSKYKDNLNKRALSIIKKSHE